MRHNRLRTGFAALLWLVLACWLSVVPAALAAPRIGIATMQPGEIFFERFGHNAIVVDDSATGISQGEPLSYNFGFFDMGEADFTSRFVKGDMRYYLARLRWRDDLQYYLDSGRGVSIQWLDLDDAQAEAMAAALAENARPENARYRYDYFIDNCATRVRDAIDRAIGGALKPQLTARSQGNTFRSEAVRLASPAPWMWLGFDIGLGPSSDQPMSRWEEAYVPMRLAASLREAKRPDGRPLVLSEETVAPHRIAPEPPEFQRAWWQWLFAGLAIAALWSWLQRRRPRIAAGLALVFWSVAALVGTLMLAIWLGTEHRFGWANHNLMLLSPPAWLLLPGGWRLARGRSAGGLFRLALIATVTLAILAPFLHWIVAVPQTNAHWIALLLPIHAAFGIVWLRASPQARSS
ncbi:MAG: DUF4105 domain-containing protein [Xanthomonadales bacterium]|nr:DUF4105 domain-containing protein [Xanthomonadales bacterium]